MGLFQHVPRGATAVIPHTRQPHRLGNTRILLPSRPQFCHLHWVHITADGGQGDTQDGCAVPPLPPKPIMGKGVGVIPPQLLGGKVANPPLGEQLGQLPGKAKTIRQPRHWTGGPKPLLAIALTVEDLPRQGFTANGVQLRLHPQPRIHRPGTRRDRSLGLVEQIWLMGFQPLKQGRTGVGVGQRRKVPLQLQHRLEGTLGGLPGILNGPQPSQI